MTVSPAQQLPKLQGSPKQIRWAEQIRTAIVNAVEERIAEGAPACATPALRPCSAKPATQGEKENATQVREAEASAGAPPVAGTPPHTKYHVALARFAAELRAHTSAEWWIYNRYRRYGDRAYLETIIRARMEQEEDGEL